MAVAAQGASGPALLNIRSPAEVTAAERQREQDLNDARLSISDLTKTNLAGHITAQWEIMRRNRLRHWDRTLLDCARAINREYSPETLAAIRMEGGSENFSSMTATKCLAATALLSEVYDKKSTGERPWGFDPTPVPKIPQDLIAAIDDQIDLEQQAHEEAKRKLMEMGGSQDPALNEKLREDDHQTLGRMMTRTADLMAEAARAAKRIAIEEAKKAEDAVDDVLTEGGFYTMLNQLILDLPVYPFAVGKQGVRMENRMVWENGFPVKKSVPKIFFKRVSPFDIYFSPGVDDIAKADVIERQRLTRSEINAFIGVDGYDQDAVRAVLQEYGRGGLHNWMDSSDQQRADLENRESPSFNESGLIDCIEYHGAVQGRMLRGHGFPASAVPDEDMDYMVQAWMIGRHVIRVQLSPALSKRAPYFLTSYRKQPGTIVGQGVAQIVMNRQMTINGALRALENNMAMASGPQVLRNEERIREDDDGQLRPWKVWNTRSDPDQGTVAQRAPIEFFQPGSNAAELLGIIEKQEQAADEDSAIPRYVTGNERLGGAGRTASGLAMLMGNAQKVLKMVCSNIDADIIKPALEWLYDLLMLTGQGQYLRGDETIVTRGASVTIQRETGRQRKLEFMQIVGQNPQYSAIIGLEGQRALLESFANDAGPEMAGVVPSKDAFESRQAQAEINAREMMRAQAMQAMAGAMQPQEGNGGSPPKQPGVASQPAVAPSNENQASADGMRAMVSQGTFGP